MNNNDVIRRLRYTFDFSDTQMIELFGLGSLEVTRTQISDWLKADDDEAHQVIPAQELAAFLNGFIVAKRGKKDGKLPALESTINNNIILRKIKIALSLKDVDMVEILGKADLKVSKHELNAFFRKPEQRQYRECKNQFLRNFLHGLQLVYRKKEDA